MDKERIQYKQEIEDSVRDSIKLKQLILKKNIDQINIVAEIMISAYKNNKKVIWFGNGGSAADAQHLSCELVSKFLIERKAIPSIALTTNTSILTAVSNDHSFDKVFARQVEAFAEKGDVLVGITTSGMSPNIIKALEAGKKIGTINIALTGENVQKIQDCADYLIDVPSNDTPKIQETHIMIGHILCGLIEKSIV